MSHTPKVQVIVFVYQCIAYRYVIQITAGHDADLLNRLREHNDYCLEFWWHLYAHELKIDDMFKRSLYIERTGNIT
jgi:hypothetical protein